MPDMPSSVGYMVGPRQGNRIPHDGRYRAFDNDCFNGLIDVGVWRAYLERYRLHRNILFAVVPDVYCDASATLAQWPTWAEVGREYGMPLAFVAQNGFDSERVPWNEFDALFIGGNDTFKESESGGWDAVREGKRRGKWVHVGRVNGWRRFSACAQAGVGSVDGTYLCFGPKINAVLLRGWQMRKEQQMTLDWWA